MTTPINSITIPPSYVQLCREWHNGQASMMYAIASTGNLTLGTVNPYTYSREEWYYSLFNELSCEIHHLSKCDSQIKELFQPFHNWVHNITDKLAEEYNL